MTDLYPYDSLEGSQGAEYALGIAKSLTESVQPVKKFPNTDAFENFTISNRILAPTKIYQDRKVSLLWEDCLLASYYFGSQVAE